LTKALAVQGQLVLSLLFLLGLSVNKGRSVYKRRITRDNWGGCGASWRRSSNYV